MEEPCRSAASEERSQEVFFGLEKRDAGGKTDAEGRRGRMQIEGRDRCGREKRKDENRR